MKETVARLMDEARRRAGSSAELVRLLDGYPYSKQAVTNWVRGRSEPPASVLLTACKVTGISVDAALFGEGAVEERLKKIEAALGLTTDQ